MSSWVVLSKHPGNNSVGKKSFCLEATIRSFDVTLHSLMTGCGFDSAPRFFEFLGGERVLGVTGVYFSSWLKGKSLPRTDKLELLLASLPTATQKLEVVRAYLSSLAAGETQLGACVEALLAGDVPGTVNAAPPPKAPAAAEGAYEISATQLTYLASQIEHYKLFSCLLARRALALGATTARLAELTAMAKPRLVEILSNFERFDLVQKAADGTYMLAAKDVAWPRDAEAKPALLLLNEYDRQLHGSLERRVKNRSLLFTVNAAAIEPFMAKVRTLENELYAREGEASVDGATLVLYQSVIYANDVWLKP